MIALKSFIQQIIYIAIISIIIELIMPKGNTKKYVYVILSLFVFLNILSPVINIIKDIDVQNTLDRVLETISSDVEENSIDISEFSEYANTKVKSQLEEKLSNEIKAKVISMNIVVKEVKIKIDGNNNFKTLEIIVENMENLGENKITKIGEIITLVAENYAIDEKNIIISEEGK